MSLHPHPHVAPPTRRATRVPPTPTTLSPSPPPPRASNITDPLPVHSTGCREARGGPSRDFGPATEDRAVARPATPHTRAHPHNTPSLPPTPTLLVSASRLAQPPHWVNGGAGRDQPRLYTKPHTSGGGGRRHPARANPNQHPPIPTPSPRLPPCCNLAHAPLRRYEGGRKAQPRLWSQAERPHPPPRGRAVGRKVGRRGLGAVPVPAGLPVQYSSTSTANDVVGTGQVPGRCGAGGGRRGEGEERRGRSAPAAKCLP